MPYIVYKILFMFKKVGHFNYYNSHRVLIKVSINLHLSDRAIVLQRRSATCNDGRSSSDKPRQLFRVIARRVSYGRLRDLLTLSPLKTRICAPSRVREPRDTIYNKNCHTEWTEKINTVNIVSRKIL